MKKYLSILFFALAFISSHQVYAASRVVYDGFPPVTPGVGPSPQNEPEDDPFRYFQVYLPDGYDQEKDKHYPVIYFLHGFGQNYSSYSGMFARLDQDIAQGLLEPVIVVKADGSVSDGWLGSFFINSALNGNFEDYIVDELRSYVNKHYRTKTHPGATEIAGHGMGGYAAILLGIKHPDVYSKITSHSPSTIVAMKPQVFNPSFYNGVLQEIPVSGLSAGKILPTNGPNSYQLFALSAALSPNLDHSPFMLDLPVQVNADFTPILVNGQLQPNEAVLQRWLLHDPYTIISESREVQKQLKKSQSLYIDYGRHETVIDTTGVKLLKKLLKKLEIPFQSHVCKGTSFDQTEIYTPSNDIPESLVQPILEQTVSFLVPDSHLQPKPLVDFVIRAINANPQQFDATTFSNFGGFLNVVCGIQSPPPTTGDLLIDPAFLACLASQGIDPDEFIQGYFEITGLIAIDPLFFKIETDGFNKCCHESSKNCPDLLFQPFKSHEKSHKFSSKANSHSES